MQNVFVKTQAALEGLRNVGTNVLYTSFYTLLSDSETLIFNST